MKEYDKSAFLAGYRAAFALRGWGTFGLRCVRQALFYEPYTVVWNGENSFTVTWVARENISQGLIMLPGLTPVTLNGSTNASGRQQGNFQWGTCRLDGFLPPIIRSGEGREWWANGIPNNQAVTIADPTNMSSVFCGEVYTTPGVKLTLTVSW